MPEKLTVEELVKAVRCCGRPNGDACNNCPGDKYKSCTSVMAQAADALESLVAERDGYREQLAAALAENTRLAQQAVPVQCKNCKNGWSNGGYSKNNTWKSTVHCDKHGCDMDATGFCSYGERKEEK